MKRTIFIAVFLVFLCVIASNGNAHNAIFNVKEFGALGDGKADDTEAIQKAIDTCTEAGGGTVLLPPGEYLSRSLYLRDNVNFNVSSGAMLKGSTKLEDYPFDEVLWSVGGGLRWNTIVGPVRAEYGYNLTPRSFDPVGTFHFSVGYPF